MAWQLIYTSTPRGLVAGRSGFCTVARHPEIRERLVAEIERCSAMDRSFSQIAGAGTVPPVIAAHRIVDLGDATYHVLSMIQDAGLDYTGRTNHIAHHLICEEHELNAAASPAQILRSFHWLKRWDSAPRYLGAPEKVHLAQIGERISMPASHWEQLDGHDGAKALLLTEDSALAGCYLVCRPTEEQSLLPLFEESLFLMDPRNVSPSKLWQVRFTTFLQGTDNARDFDWRGCWENSPAHLAAQKGRERVLVLSQAQGWPAPKNAELIAYAQSGIRVPPRKVRPEPTAAAPAETGTRGYVQPSPASVLFAEDQEAVGSGRRRPRNRRGAKYFIIALALLLILGAIGVSWYLSVQHDNQVEEQRKKTAREAAQQSALAEQASKDIAARKAREERERKERETADIIRAGASSPKNTTPTEAKPVEPPATAVKPPLKAVPQEADWLATARKQLPQVPTYIFIDDLRKGVNVQAILAANKLLDKDGKPKLRAVKALLSTNGAAEQAFLDASSSAEAKALDISGLPNSDNLMLRIVLKNVAKLDARALITRLDVDDTWAHWAQATLYVPCATNAFQIALFDEAHVSKTNAPFRAAHLSRKTLTEKPCLQVADQLRDFLFFCPGTTSQPMQCYLRSPALEKLEAEPLLKEVVKSGRQYVPVDVNGVYHGALAIDLARIKQELIKREAKAKEAERLRQGTPPKMAYTEPGLHLEGAGTRLLGKDCPDHLKTFSEYLSKPERKFNADKWENPWHDYTDYLRDIFRWHNQQRVKRLENELAKAKNEQHGPAAKEKRREIDWLLNNDESSDKLNAFEEDPTKPPELGKNFYGEKFSKAWEEFFIKEKGLQATIKNGMGPINNNSKSKEKQDFEDLVAAAKQLPQKNAELFPLTLNLKIRDFDWPIAVFE